MCHRHRRQPFYFLKPVNKGQELHHHLNERNNLMPKRGEFKPGAKARSVQQREFNSTPLQKKRRNERNVSRARVVASGAPVNGKDIDHRDKNTGNMSRKNLRVRSVGSNRADNR